MRSQRRHRSFLAPRVGSLLAMLALASPASAGDLSLLLRPRYFAYTTTTIDEAGESTRSAGHELAGRYSASWQRHLYPLLALSLRASLDDRRTLVSLGDAPPPSGQRSSTLGGDLRFGPRNLHGAVQYSRTQRSTFSANGTSLSNVAETAAATGELRPAALPKLQLRLSHDRTYDVAREQHDVRSIGASLSAQHVVSPISLRYTVAYRRPTDEIRHTTTSTISQQGTARVHDSLLSGRMRVAASYRINASSTRVERVGPTGLVISQRYPVAGLSRIDDFPTEPTEGPLNPNPALIDGDTATSANINLGYGPSLDDDTQPRELGVAQAPTSDEPIDLVYVWTDRWLPSDISSLYTWSVYASEDNQRWEPLLVTSPATYATFHNRFEIGVRATTAQYIKLVATPLPATASTDEEFRDIYITELQVFEALAADAESTATTNAASTAYASVSSRLHPREALDHSLSIALQRRHLPIERTSYSLSNSLGYRTQVDIVMLSAHLSRHDTENTSGHRASWAWGASASARPLAPLHHAVTYSGAYSDTAVGNSISNGLSLTNRARLYRGVSVMANTAYGWSENGDGSVATTRSFATSAALTPHPRFSLTGDYGYSSSSAGSGGDAGRSSNSRARLTTSARPLPTLSLHASITAHARTGADTRVLASYGGSFSPLRDGTLTLSASYGEWLELATDGVVRRGSAGLRWKIGPRWSADGSYSYLASISQAAKTHTHAALVELTGRLL